GFDARSENPAGSADPVRSTGRAGRGVLSLRQVSLHKQRKVARAVTARKLLILMSAKERRVKTRPAGPQTRQGGPPRTRPRRLRGPGAQHRARRPGCAFFAPGFFAQAKKGGSRRHGAKAFDLDVGERAAGQDPPYEAAEEQERLAALAPSSALRAPSPASGRRAGRPMSRRREKG